jgi:hypothetical protein
MDAQYARAIGLLVHAIGSNTFIIVRIMEPFWFFAGIVLMLPELEHRASPSAASAARPAPRPATIRPGARPAAAERRG